MNGWGAGWWLVGGLFMVLCMGMMIWMMAGMMSHGQSAPDASVGAPDPERTLADRLAKGEIDVEEYNRRRDALRAGNRSTTS